MIASFVTLGLVVFMAIVLVISNAMGLKGTQQMVFIGAMTIIGAALAAAVVVFLQKKKKSGGGGAAAGAAGGAEDVDLVLREAEAKLASSQLSGARYSSLPAIFVLGPQGSAKTTSMVYSGLEPELLAGQVYRDNAIIPTTIANLWFAGRAVFLEAGAKLFADDSAWAQVIKKLHPGKLHSVFSKSTQSPRAAVICVDLESFLKPQAGDQMAALSRQLRGRLGEISRLLGINVPVYVLFTKMDRVPFFHDYVQNLRQEEVSQVVGATLPMAGGATSGVYGEQMTRKLNDSFDRLFLGLCDKRRDFLARENDNNKLPGTYEFPREFRKLRNGLVTFLVDLCRPSQLTTAPFLRGYYFSGVRPVVVSDVAPAPIAPKQEKSFIDDSGATRIFRLGESGQEFSAAAARSSNVGRRVPQWVFLDHVMNDVVLADNAALGASASSTKTSALRRALLIAAAVFSLILSVVFLISFLGNRKLEQTAIQAAKGITATEGAKADLPSLDSLSRLETLRQSLETLADYERNGAPWSMRWGLYAGSGLYPEVRQIYFDKFRQVMFGSTQERMVTSLAALPAAPGPDDNPGIAYDTLKAYLMTTSHHEKTDQQFLPTTLMNRWLASRTLDAERTGLARKQFEFYSKELYIANMYNSTNDAETVKHARAYLLQAGSAVPIYKAMIAEANRRFPTLNFNKQFPGTAEVVVNNRDVTGAFSKGGWGFMQDAINNPDRYFKGEEWVLGDQAAARMDRTKLIAALKALYYPDFTNQWRDYLRKGAVVKYQDLADASKKLTRTASAQSPLLAMLCLASQNSGVDDPDTAKYFKPLHGTVPPTCADQYITKENNDYMRSLSDLEISLEDLLKQPSGPGADRLADQTHEKARAALSVTRQMSLTVGLDPGGDMHDSVHRLVEQPITYADALLQRLGPQELNAKGKELCAQLKPFFAKYPFNPKSQVKATLDDVNTVFRPQQGLIWAFYEQNLKKLLPKRGSEFFSEPGAPMQATPAFLRFLNNMAAFSNALYSSGPDPKLTYSMRPILSQDITSVRLAIDGVTADFVGASAPKQFSWPGAMTGTRLSLKEGGTDFVYPTWDGLWGVWAFFLEADNANERANGGTYEWRLRGGANQRAVTGSRGQPIVSGFDLDTGAQPNVFRKGYFSQMVCVADIAK